MQENLKIMSNDFSDRDRGKTLIITEGPAEVDILKKIFTSFPKMKIKDADIIVYRSNIYKLYKKIIKEYGEHFYQDDVDIPYVISKDSGEKEYRKRDFINIFLIFDFEAQDSGYEYSKLEKLLECFKESTDNGKMYINFPMLESYMHILSFDQNEYNMLRIDRNAIKKGKYYKTLVSRNSIVKPYFVFEDDISGFLKKNKADISDENRALLIDSIKDSHSIPEFKSSIENFLDKKNGSSFQKYMEHKLPDLFHNNVSYNDYLHKLLIRLIILNIEKGLFLLNKHDNWMLNYNSFNLEEITAVISDALREYGYIYVLNCMLYIVPDYNIKLLEC